MFVGGIFMMIFGILLFVVGLCMLATERCKMIRAVCGDDCLILIIVFMSVFFICCGYNLIH